MRDFTRLAAAPMIEAQVWCNKLGIKLPIHVEVPMFCQQRLADPKLGSVPNNHLQDQQD